MQILLDYLKSQKARQDVLAERIAALETEGKLEKDEDDKLSQELNSLLAEMNDNVPTIPTQQQQPVG